MLISEEIAPQQEGPEGRVLEGGVALSSAQLLLQLCDLGQQQLSALSLCPLWFSTALQSSAFLQYFGAFYSMLVSA